jgi:hypothetical protein
LRHPAESVEECRLVTVTLRRALFNAESTGVRRRLLSDDEFPVSEYPPRTAINELLEGVPEFHIGPCPSMRSLLQVWPAVLYRPCFSWRRRTGHDRPTDRRHRLHRQLHHHPVSPRQTIWSRSWRTCRGPRPGRGPQLHRWLVVRDPSEGHPTCRI